MHLIEVENFEMRITEEFFLAKPLRELYNKYYQKDNDKFMEYLSVIYHYADPRSSYSYIIDDNERLQEIVVQEGLSKGFKLTKELQECIECYKTHVITLSYRLLQSTKIAIDKLSNYLEKIDFDERDDKGKAVYTISSITQAIRQIPQLSKDLLEAEKIITKEIEENGRARGGNENKAVFEDGINFDE